MSFGAGDVCCFLCSLFQRRVRLFLALIPWLFQGFNKACEAWLKMCLEFCLLAFARQQRLCSSSVKGTRDVLRRSPAHRRPSATPCMAGAAAAGYASDDSPNLALVYTSRHPLHERTLLRGRREVYKRAEVAGALVHLIDRDQGDSGGGGGLAAPSKKSEHRQCRALQGRSRQALTPDPPTQTSGLRRRQLEALGVRVWDFVFS